MNVSVDSLWGSAVAMVASPDSPRQSVAMMFSLQFKGVFAPSKAFVFLNLDPGPVSREQKILIGHPREPFWTSEELAVAMVSALTPLRLDPAGMGQINIKSCLAAVDVARGHQSPRDSGAASVCVESKQGQGLVGTRVWSDICVLKANLWS